MGDGDRREALPALALGRAGAADAPEIARLARGVMEEAWSERGFADQASKPGAVLWTARSGARGELLGFLVGERILDELHVLSVAVAPATRRRGIARSLLARALEAASSAGVEVVHLELRASNRAARSLYEGFGFVAVGRRPRYYRVKGKQRAPTPPHDNHDNQNNQNAQNPPNPREDAVLMTPALSAWQNPRPGP
ncbi:MAG: GNAT family N-acetyltransferase [Deltaproteobacteria bacterium]|nr:GNAT family N-acetyltransferase [Deltaproteobacteria bacterium]MBW2419591.1 GNAT family N-acetyltransferase [Deltaproteobacteria bacterium]